jgi:WD40 repeat protein
MNNRRAPAAIASRLSLTVAICLLAPELPASQETPPAPPGNSVELIVNKHHGGAVALDLSSDGRFFVLPNGTTLELWDAIKGRRIRTFGGFRDDVFSAAISRDGKRVAAGTSELGESEIYVWDTETGRVDAKWRVLAVQNWGSGKPYSTTAALTFSADGRQIIAVGNFNNRELKDSTISLEIARILDIATGRLLNSIEIAGSSHARSVALALDGRTFAVGFQGGVTRRYDLNGRLVGVINSPDTTGAVDSVAFSPSGRLLALGNASYPKKSTDVEIRDVRSGRLVRTIPSDRTGRAVGIAWAPDGTTIAIGGAFGLQVWDVESGSLKGENNGVYARGVRYKPDGSEIFTPGFLLDARTLKSKKAFGEDVTYLLGASASSREALVPAGNCRLYAIDVLTGAISKYFERTATDGICPLGSLSGDGRTSCAWVIDRAVNNSRSVIFSNLFDRRHHEDTGDRYIVLPFNVGGRKPDCCQAKQWRDRRLRHRFGSRLAVRTR